MVMSMALLTQSSQDSDFLVEIGPILRLENFDGKFITISVGFTFLLTSAIMFRKLLWDVPFLCSNPKSDGWDGFWFELPCLTHLAYQSFFDEGMVR